MENALIHFYSDRNVGDAAIHAAIERLADERGMAILGPDARETGREARCLVSVGGDIFNNARGGLVTRRFLQKLDQLRWAPERTMLFGQSIPPSCDGIALRLLARHLRRISSVTVRDTESVAKLARFGVKARLSVDTVFSCTAADADLGAAAQVYAQAGLAPERTALFSIRGFNRMYQLDEGDYRGRIAATMRRLHDEGRSIAILLQANVNDDDADPRFAQELMRDFNAVTLLDPFAHGETPWRTALGVTALAETVIGTRYHTAIFRMVAGRMPVGLWYSNKGEDLHRRLSVPGADAAAFDPATIARAALDASQTPFDPAPLRRDVEARFRDAHSRASGALAAA